MDRATEIKLRALELYIYELESRIEKLENITQQLNPS